VKRSPHLQRRGHGNKSRLDEEKEHEINKTSVTGVHLSFFKFASQMYSQKIKKKLNASTCFPGFSRYLKATPLQRDKFGWNLC